jgi:fructose-specific component phosphotransferase system IIB-like protein
VLRVTSLLALLCAGAALSGTAFAADGHELKGKISAVSDTQVTVVDGPNTLTCAVPAARNYSLAASFHVGDAVSLACRDTAAGLVLTGLHRQGGDKPSGDKPGTTTTTTGTNEHPGGDHPTTTTSPGTGAGSSPPSAVDSKTGLQGKITAVSDTQITVVDGPNTLTCAVPTIRNYKLTTFFHTGDPVRIVCRSGRNGLTLAELHRVGGDRK